MSGIGRHALRAPAPSNPPRERGGSCASVRALLLAHITLAAIAGAGLALFWIAVAETWRPGAEPSVDSKLREDKFLPASP